MGLRLKASTCLLQTDLKFIWCPPPGDSDLIFMSSWKLSEYQPLLVKSGLVYSWVSHMTHNFWPHITWYKQGEQPWLRLGFGGAPRCICSGRLARFKRRLFVIGGWKMMDIENSSTYKKHVSFATNEGRVDLKIKKIQLNSWISLNHVEPRNQIFHFHPLGLRWNRLHGKPRGWKQPRWFVRGLPQLPPNEPPIQQPRALFTGFKWKTYRKPWFSVLHGFYPPRTLEFAVDFSLQKVSWLR